MKHKSSLELLTFLLICLSFHACVSRETQVADGKNEMEEASLISLYDRGEYEEVLIMSPDGREVAHYVIVDREASLTSDLPKGAEVLRVPVRSLATDSEVYASALEEIDGAECIKGMFDAQFVTSQTLKTRVEEGKIVHLGAPASPSIEKLIELQPEAVMVSYYDGMQMLGIDKLNVPIVKMYDLQETSPLGRAEWLRFIGRLAGKGEKADSIFKTVKKKYEALKSEVPTETFRPKILTETPYEGVWYVPGGASYQAKLIEDAGGTYFKACDKSTGSLNLSLEQVLDGGSDADIWLVKVFGKVPTKTSLKKENPLYEEFKPFKTGDIYFSDTSSSGLFREFPFHPELLLEDYRVIFSGEPGYSLRYFKKIEE